MNLFAAEEEKLEQYNLYTDGGSRGNPGPSASGAVLYDNTMTEIARVGKYLGEQTNNYAEYVALQQGLEMAHQHGVRRLVCHLDSELIVRQLIGRYKVKHPAIKLLYKDVRRFLVHFVKVDFMHVRREKNKVADAIVNQVLDTGKAVC